MSDGMTGSEWAPEEGSPFVGIRNAFLFTFAIIGAFKVGWWLIDLIAWAI